MTSYCPLALHSIPGSGRRSVDLVVLVGRPDHHPDITVVHLQADKSVLLDEQWVVQTPWPVTRKTPHILSTRVAKLSLSTATPHPSPMIVVSSSLLNCLRCYHHQNPKGRNCLQLSKQFLFLGFAFLSLHVGLVSVLAGVSAGMSSTKWSNRKPNLELRFESAFIVRPTVTPADSVHSSITHASNYVYPTLKFK